MHHTTPREHRTRSRPHKTSRRTIARLTQHNITHNAESTLSPIQHRVRIKSQEDILTQHRPGQSHTALTGTISHSIDHFRCWQSGWIDGSMRTPKLGGQTINKFGSYSGVTLVLQCCYSGVTAVLQWFHRGITVMLQWCFHAYAKIRWTDYQQIR
jgi:hypothetical protein